jgi:hypothetical protein
VNTDPDRRAPRLFDDLRPGDAASPPGTVEGADSTPANGVAAPAEETTTGRLAPEARRALVSLLKQGVILSSDKRLLYESICRHRAAIEAHLADMYLRLLLDERDGVALLMQQHGEERETEDEDEAAVALVNRRRLSLYDTLLLLVLRKHYQERQASGEQSVHVDFDHIESRLSPFLPLTTSTRTDRRRLSGAIEKMIERRLLARVRGDEERFEITPVIRYVVNAEVLEHLLGQYRALLEQAGDANDDGEQRA